MRRIFYTLPLVFLAILTSCGFLAPANSPPTPAPVKGNSTFEIHILADSFDSLKLGYKWDAAWRVLKQVYPQYTLATITDQDIEEYNWSEQTIKLTTNATQSLLSKFKVSSASEIDMVFGVSHRAFVVTLDGSPQYGGLFLVRGSQMAISYPVIYMDYQDNGNLVLTIRPFHTVITGDLAPSDQAWAIVRQESIRSSLAQTDKLRP